jgi:hypothetical protein
MRRTFASIVDHSMVQRQDIADMMGHSDLNTFYGHMVYPEGQPNPGYDERRLPEAKENRLPPAREISRHLMVTGIFLVWAVQGLNL